MILTPIPDGRLPEVLDRFAAQLDDPAAQAAFVRIRATSRERAEATVAERHRRRAIAIARTHGLPVHPPGTPCRFNWDGTALDGDTEAYVILHEIAHFVLAPPERRTLVDFGLGPGPDTKDRAAAERAATLPLIEREADEAAASLLGISGRRNSGSRRWPRSSTRTGWKGSGWKGLIVRPPQRCISPRSCRSYSGAASFRRDKSDRVTDATGATADRASAAATGCTPVPDATAPGAAPACRAARCASRRAPAAGCQSRYPSAVR